MEARVILVFWRRQRLTPIRQSIAGCVSVGLISTQGATIMRFVVWGCLFLPVTAATGQMPSIPSVEDVEKRTIEHREKIKTAVLELHSRVTTIRGVEAVLKESRIRAYLDGGRLRLDYERKTGAGDAYKEFVCRSEEGVWHYTTETPPGGGSIITSIYDSGDANAEFYKTPDPRIIGMCACEFANLVHYEINSIIGNRYKDPVIRISSEEKDGLACDRINYDRAGSVTDAWISPERDYSIVALEKNFGRDRVTLDCNLSEVKGYGWFPSQATLSRFRDGVLTREELLSIRVQQINRRLDSNTFSFVGMNVPVGEKIYDFRGDGYRQWTMSDTGLAPLAVRATAMGVERDAERGVRSLLSVRMRWILAVNAVVLIFCAIFFLFRWRRRDDSKLRGDL